MSGEPVIQIRGAPGGGRGADGNVAAWLDAARGHLLIFWGLASGLVLFTGAMKFSVLEQSRIPPHLIGAALVAMGVFVLRRGAPESCRPPARLWAPAALMLYFVPFVAWWSDRPHVGFFIANLMAMAAATGWLLVGICRAAGQVGRARGYVDFAIEARVSEWLCGLLVAGPLAAMGALAVAGLLRNGTSFYAEWFAILYALPRWLFAGAILPFTIAMACAWRARGLCMEAARRSAREAPAPAGEGFSGSV